MDEKGYVSHPEHNLIEGVMMHQFESDLKKGAGNELRRKFLAVHSSTALAVNSFAPFKDTPEKLIYCGKSGFTSVSFEKECRTGLRGGTHPHLDVWLECGSEVLAVESKLTEYFKQIEAEYKESYQRKIFPYAEDCWWDLLEESKTAEKQHLDVAQLVKHYLGLIRHLETTGISSVTLLYLYWEPLNAADIEVCLKHRQEIATFSEQVADSKVSFKSMSYTNLWHEWGQIPDLNDHANNLRKRYDVEI
tara:strand:+ start:19648 stop:20391 length:744 start_codon:yes stop_codon:yes gene_type:complete